MMPQLCQLPTASCTKTLLPVMGAVLTSDGLCESRAVPPLPSCPYRSSPQQYAMPFAVKPQVWFSPEAIFTKRGSARQLSVGS